MNLSLENKHAIICGSSDGIGKASAIKMAQRGCEITLVARNQEKLDSTLLELNTKQGQQHQTVCVDFDQPEKVKESVTLHIGSLGKPVDILINNSGGPHGGPIIEADENEFRVAFERLLICNQIMAKAVFPGMKEQGSGRIINIISTSVKIPIAGLGVSNTIRGAVASWAKTMSNELGQFGITVNNVLPGFTDTNRLKSLITKKAENQGVSEEQIANGMKAQIPAARFAQAKEVANAAAFLCSPAAAYINGINVPVDGGRTGAL